MTKSLSKLNSWLIGYERRRTSGEAEMSQLLEVRSDLQGLSWDEIRDMPVVQNFTDEPMTIGKTFSALKKSWRSLKLYRRDGMPTSDLALRIVKAQHSLGLPLSEFDELDTNFIHQELDIMDNDGGGLSEEERQEQNNLDSEVTDLDRQLLAEEMQDIRERMGLDSEEQG
jgi:hypothetical protein